MIEKSPRDGAPLWNFQRNPWEERNYIPAHEHLVHFGSKEIVLRSREKSSAFPTKDAVSIVAEVTKAHMADEWVRFSPNPFLAISNKLGTVPILSSWHPRWWQGKGKTQHPAQADKFTINLLVAKESWSSKSHKGFGVQVPKTPLEQHRKTLLPGMVFQPGNQERDENGILFRLFPTPLGANRDDVQTFLSRQPSVEGPRVVKQVGPRLGRFHLHPSLDRCFFTPRGAMCCFSHGSLNLTGTR